MTSRTEGNRDVMLFQQIVRTHDVIGRFNLMVDMLESAAPCRHKSERMMNLIHAQKRNVSDTVTDAGVANLGPECFIPLAVLAENADMAEAGDSGVPARKMTLAHNLWLNYQLDFQATGLSESNEVSYMTGIAFVAGAPMQIVSKIFESRSRDFKCLTIADFETDDVVVGVPFVVV
ncbi:hypothetical protein A3731_09795 [Roseovarius sp. HI0049]|nr:hypothetical protein A3731_09795 [Roseovarius sp. HI0049]